MKRTKRGSSRFLIGITLVFLGLLFSLFSVTGADDDVGLCYEHGKTVSCNTNTDYITVKECTDKKGISTFDNPEVCTEGCCCFYPPNKPEKPEFLTSIVGSNGYCNYLNDNVKVGEALSPLTEADGWFVNIKKSDLCAAQCKKIAETIVSEGASACSNGKDDDNDEKIDLEDLGCKDAKDNDEKNPVSCKANDIKPLGEKQECLCGSGENTQTCSQNQFCSGGKCVTALSGKSCLEGDKYIHSITNNCAIVSICQNGQFVLQTDAQGKPLQDCPKDYEVCDIIGDEDQQNGQDCKDPLCSKSICYDEFEQTDDDYCKQEGVKNCYQNKAKSACVINNIDYGADVEGQSKVYACCENGLPPVNCGDFGYQCGSCSCENAAVPKSPQLTLSQNEPGIPNIIVKIQSKCPVPVTVEVCRVNTALIPEEGAKNNCFDKEGNFQGSVSTPASSYGADAYNKKGEIIHYESVIEESTYYVRLKAVYPNDKYAFSEIKSITTGSKACLSLPIEQNKPFCTNTPEEKKTVYQCDENNVLSLVKQCGGMEICVQKAGGADCVKQSPCIFCGIPFNMFADKDKSILQLEPKSKDLCKNEPLCYYDYTDTAKDAFAECQYVSTCYDYRSKESCQSASISSTTGTANKCLGRECVWTYTNEKLNLGICAEKDEEYRFCEYCNSAEHNNVFDACTRDRCIAFSSSKNNCFIETDLDECKAEPFIGCSDYLTKADCTAKDGDNSNKELAIDLEKEVLPDGTEKFYGTHIIKVPSNDFLGLGVCRWIKEEGDVGDNAQRCIKDANNDFFEDLYNDRDNIPPVTTLLSPTITSIFNLTFAAVDPQPKGKFESAPVKTYYCYQEIKESSNCYPDKLYTKPETLPFDHGKWKLRFYSEDKAENLEVIKEKIITVDREKPEIIITQVSSGLKSSSDLYSGYVTLTISFNNEDLAFCTDNFEGKKNNGELYNTLVSKSTVVTYKNLKDGYYMYSVACVDVLGNKGEASQLIKIENDERIQNLLPTKVLDYEPVELSMLVTAKYGKPVGCKFSDDPDKDTFIEISGSDNSFDEPTEITFQSSKDKAYKYTKSYTPVEAVEGSGDWNQALTVVCKFSNSDESVDEIQFVYDIKPPTTTIVDVAHNLFDTNKFYKGEEIVEKVFFSCKDNPQHGFGCDKTYWCIKDQKCDPIPSPNGDGVLYDEMNPFNPELSDPGAAPWICYYSEEKTAVDPISGNTMGGRKEAAQCIVVKTDTEDPNIYTKYKTADGSSPFEPFEEENIKEKYNSFEEGALLWPLNYIELLITVDDPDALETDDAQNRVDVVVANLQQTENETSADGEKTDDKAEFSKTFIKEYKNLDAKKPVELQVALGEGLNQIEIKATDRSGAINVKNYYVLASDLPGDILEITKPYHGISDVMPLIFEIKIKEEYGLAAEQCALYDDSNILQYTMEKKAGGKIFEIKLTALTESVPYQAKVKCIFSDGKFTEKQFTLVYDKTQPQIISLEIIPHNNKIPPTLMDLPIEGKLVVTTDDKTRCKLSKVPNESYVSMKPFESYVEELESLFDVAEKNEQVLSQAQTIPEFKIEDKQIYTYYVKCDNGLLDDNHITNEKNITFVVDTSLATDLKVLSPPLYTSKKTIEIILETSKSAVECTFGSSEAEINLTKFTSTNSNKNHKSGSIAFEKDGQYEYWVQCTFPGSNMQKRDIDFVIDTTPPVFVSIDDGNVTDKLSQLSAAWKFEDNASQIEGYEFSIGTAPSQTNIYNWTNTTSSTVTVDKLKLLNNTVYYWNVRALNKAGLWSGIASSNGITVDTTKGKSVIALDQGEDLCFNSFQDPGETGIDCGGECNECLNDQTCSTDLDCASGKCVNNVCVAATCTDNILNQDESDIDCGGSSCTACVLGKQCNMHADCGSNYCKLGVCAEASCIDGIYNGNEDGKDCGGDCSPCEYEEYKPDEEEGEIDLSKETPEEKSSWLLVIMVVIFLLLAGGGGYYYYTTMYMPQQRKSGSGIQEPIYKPLQRQIVEKMKPLFAKRPLSKEQLAQRELTKQKQRESIVEAFEEHKEEKKEEKQEHEVEVKKPSEEKQDISKLKQEAGKKQKTKKLIEKEERQKAELEKQQPKNETAFEKLKQFNQQSKKQDNKDIKYIKDNADVFEKLKQLKRDKK